MKLFILISRMTFTFFILVTSNASADNGLSLTNLRTEYKTNPVGIDILKPRLNWEIQSDKRKTMQTAYEIRFASNTDLLKRSESLLWQNKVNTDQSIHVVYEGPELQSRQRIYWQVKVWDNHGRNSGWSEPVFWEMGFLKEGDWSAQWIEAEIEEDTKQSQPAQYFRKEFDLSNQIKSARLYITSHGLYEGILNDKRVGDQVFAPTACFNMDAATFYTKWLQDLALDQNDNGMVADVIPNVLGSDNGGHTGWGDAAVVIPWTVYLNYGDKRILLDQYDSMNSWIQFMRKRAGEDYLWDGDWHYGDWLSFDDSSPAYMGAYTTTDLIATAYYAYSTGLLSKIARILGKERDAEELEDLVQKIKNAFANEFLTPNGRLVSHTQTAYTLALAMDLIPENLKEKVSKNFYKNVDAFKHITTGFLGTPLISQTLTDNGYLDMAYLLLNRKKYPSWLYPVTMGATTIWERWDGIKPDSTFQNPGMNSLNHYAYGAIGKWLYSTVAGIDIDVENPGYKNILIRPQPGGGLTHAKAEIKTMYGLAASAWKFDENQDSFEVTIPPNTTATVYLPFEDMKKVRSDGKLISEDNEFKIRYDEQKKPLLKLGSGNYKFTAISP